MCPPICILHKMMLMRSSLHLSIWFVFFLVFCINCVMFCHVGIHKRWKGGGGEGGGEGGGLVSDSSQHKLTYYIFKRVFSHWHI
jgi:hypothetical protein